jgi:hypothetical protein
LVIPGRALSCANPESSKFLLNVFLDSGSARRSASKTRVNALVARAPE